MQGREIIFQERSKNEWSTNKIYDESRTKAAQMHDSSFSKGVYGHPVILNLKYKLHAGINKNNI